MPQERRTWTRQVYVGYWVIAGQCCRGQYLLIVCPNFDRHQHHLLDRGLIAARPWLERGPGYGHGYSRKRHPR